jgi:hypothetical protein
MDKQLIGELRQAFLDGATPSRLIRLVVDRGGDEDRLHFTIGDYFGEAFGVPLVRHVVSGDDYSPDPRHAHFNRDLLPEIIQHLGDWHAGPRAGSWLERAEVSSLNEHVERLKAYVPEELAGVWATLSEKERRSVLRLSARLNHDWQVIKVLASLAERLQQKVVDLEAQLKEAQTAGDSPARAETSG